MGVIDIIAIAFLGYGVYQGFKNGFITELIRFLALFIGVYVAVQFSSFVGSYLCGLFEWNTKVIEIISFGLVFIAVLFFLKVFSHSTTKLVSFIRLGWLNKGLGVVFSFLKSLVLLSVLFNLFSFANSLFHWVSDEVLALNYCYNSIIKYSHIIFPEIEKWFYKTVIN